VIFTLRFLIPSEALPDAPVMGIGPNGAIRYPLPILQCEKCGALLAADMEQRHLTWHAQLIDNR